jgi:NADH:ubiquinone oxidoreductase subunit
MDLISKILIKLTSKEIGIDEFGNKYFEAKKTKNGQKKRFVIYNGTAEPSKIPSEWHGWMHYNGNIPKITQKHHWQKIHLPNLTGTKFAHKPKAKQKQQDKTSSNYQAWQPN